MYRSEIILVAFLSTFLLIHAGIFARGKARIELEKTVDCEEKSLMPFFITYNRCNKTHRCLNWNFTVYEPIGPKSVIELTGAKWGNGGWKPNAFHIKVNDMCVNLRRILGKNWETMSTEMNLKECPIQPGEYVLNNYYIDFGDLPVAFMYGKYDINYTLTQNNKLLVCKHFFLDIEA